MIKKLSVALIITIVLSLSISAAIYTATTPSEITSFTNMLDAGDTLQVETGVYDMSTWRIQNRHGSDTAWIRIQDRAVPRSRFPWSTDTTPEGCLRCTRSGSISIRTARWMRPARPCRRSGKIYRLLYSFSRPRPRCCFCSVSYFRD